MNSGSAKSSGSVSESSAGESSLLSSVLPLCCDIFLIEPNGSAGYPTSTTVEVINLGTCTIAIVDAFADNPDADIEFLADTVIGVSIVGGDVRGTTVTVVTDICGDASITIGEKGDSSSVSTDLA